jgi:hypothetical protein
VLILAGIVLLSVLSWGVLGHQPDAMELRTQAPTNAIAAAQAGDQTIEVTESELTSALNDQVAGRPVAETPLGTASIQRMSAQLRDGHMRATGNALAGSTSLPVELTASMHVENGRPLVVVDDLRAAGVPLPASAREPVQHALQAQLDQQVQARQLRITSVVVADGTLRLVGSRQ